MLKIDKLAENPNSVPSKLVINHAPNRRAKSGEYRIIYEILDNTLYIKLIGIRNDDAIYKMLDRKQ